MLYIALKNVSTIRYIFNFTSFIQGSIVSELKTRTWCKCRHICKLKSIGPKILPWGTPHICVHWYMETPTQVVSRPFCESFKTTYWPLLLSIKGTTDCLYPRVPYDIEGSVIWQYSEKKDLCWLDLA